MARSTALQPRLCSYVLGLGTFGSNAPLAKQFRCCLKMRAGSGSASEVALVLQGCFKRAFWKQRRNREPQCCSTSCGFARARVCSGATHNMCFSHDTCSHQTPSARVSENLPTVRHRTQMPSPSFMSQCVHAYATSAKNPPQHGHQHILQHVKLRAFSRVLPERPRGVVAVTDCADVGFGAIRAGRFLPVEVAVGHKTVASAYFRGRRACTLTLKSYWAKTLDPKSGVLWPLGLLRVIMRKLKNACARKL